MRKRKPTMQPNDRPETVQVHVDEPVAMELPTEELRGFVKNLDNIIAMDAHGTGPRIVNQQRRNLKLLRGRLATELAKREGRVMPPALPEEGES